MYQLVILFVLALCQPLALADMTIQINEGMRGAIPIAIVPFHWSSADIKLPEDISAVVSADLARSGRFRTLPEQDMSSRPGSGEDINFMDWHAMAQDNLVVGQVQRSSSGYIVQFQLFDVQQKAQLAAYNVPTTDSGLRATAHWIADFIYAKLIGTPGAFSTRIAYITEETKNPDGKQKVSLKVADADGYNPQTIVSSTEPLMSPAWSPDGHRLAYVSFENKQQSIYIQDLSTGKREQVAAYPGINSAPAWSPNGKSLALVLSKDGNPEIYILNLESHALTPLTKNVAIDTEPTWSPDGLSLAFTSDRGGTPQIYLVPATGGEPKRLTFQGDYNARPVYAPDGHALAIVTRRDGVFRIGLLNLADGTVRELTQGPLDEGPSFAANGSMIVYGAKVRERGELYVVSVDGRVEQQLVTNEGDVHEPACSPLVK